VRTKLEPTGRNNFLVLLQVRMTAVNNNALYLSKWPEEKVVNVPTKTKEFVSYYQPHSSP
jgi:hypothetical protein